MRTRAKARTFAVLREEKMKDNTRIKKTGRQRLLWKEALKEKDKREKLYTYCMELLKAMRNSSASIENFAAAAAALSKVCTGRNEDANG